MEHRQFSPLIGNHLPTVLLKNLLQRFDAEHLKTCVFIKGKLPQFPVQINREPEQHPLRHGCPGLA